MLREIILGAIEVAFCCSVDARKADAEPIVFVVAYHNLDYAKTSCDYVLSMLPNAAKTAREFQKYGWGEVDDTTKATLAGAVECKSVRDTRELGIRLENELLDALAVEPLCAGVTIRRDPHPDFNGGNFSQTNYEIKQAKPHWDLHLDYNPGSKIFGWTLFPNKAGMKPDGAFVNGEGSVAKAASQICIVVSGRGASIR
jgi:hypothetical protein